MSHDVVIVGAGIAGIAAARRLQAAGLECLLVDKSRGVGGRMATRRLGGARIDHGAQFFTARSAEFRSVVDRAVDAGVVREWARGFGYDDGHPRYCGVDGMTSLVKWMATDLEVALSLEVRDLRDHPADSYLLTSPIPQSLAILNFSQLLPSPLLQQRLSAIPYQPTIALLCVLESPTDLPAPGALKSPGDPAVDFVADNQQKGVSEVPSLTVHASAEWSTANWDRSDEWIADALLTAVAPQTGRVTCIEQSVMRWRYATPEPLNERCLTFGSDPVIALAGDAFGGPWFEGAFLSGLAAADALIDQLHPPRASE